MAQTLGSVYEAPRELPRRGQHGVAGTWRYLRKIHSGHFLITSRMFVEYVCVCEVTFRVLNKVPHYEDVLREWSYTSTPPIRLHGVVLS